MTGSERFDELTGAEDGLTLEGLVLDGLVLGDDDALTAELRDIALDLGIELDPALWLVVVESTDNVEGSSDVDDTTLESMAFDEPISDGGVMLEGLHAENNRHRIAMVQSMEYFFIIQPPNRFKPC